MGTPKIEHIEIDHPDKRGETVRVPVRWKRREYGGWKLVHAETGRTLGWITRNIDKPRLWDVRLASAPFRGDGLADGGDVLDRVPYYLYNGDSDNSLRSYAFSWARDREDAAFSIVWTLVNRRAPGVGFPRHPEVVPWKSRVSA